MVCRLIEYNGKMVSTCNVGATVEYILGGLSANVSWAVFCGAIAFFLLIIYVYIKDKKRFKKSRLEKSRKIKQNS